LFTSMMIHSREMPMRVDALRSTISPDPTNISLISLIELIDDARDRFVPYRFSLPWRERVRVRGQKN
jgi:hypothetical protein